MVLGQAVGLAADAGAGLVDRVVARQAAHHVRADLADRSALTRVQIGLIRGLEKLGDPDTAYEVATAALAELDALPPAERDAGQQQGLLMAALRLARSRDGGDQDDDAAVAEAVELAGVRRGGGADRSPRVGRGQPAAPARPSPGRAATGPPGPPPNWKATASTVISPRQWRLLLAFHAGRAGIRYHPAADPRCWTRSAPIPASSKTPRRPSSARSPARRPTPGCRSSSSKPNCSPSRRR